MSTLIVIMASMIVERQKGVDFRLRWSVTFSIIYGALAYIL